jgi:hypothetical protein
MLWGTTGRQDNERNRKSQMRKHEKFQNEYLKAATRANLKIRTKNDKWKMTHGKWKIEPTATEQDPGPQCLRECYYSIRDRESETTEATP